MKKFTFPTRGYTRKKKIWHNRKDREDKILSEIRVQENRKANPNMKHDKKKNKTKSKP